MMQICFFEDETCVNFKPLTLTRPADDLRTGILTIGEKWRVALHNENWSRCIRPELSELFSHNTPDKSKPCLWVNSRCLPSPQLCQKVDELDKGNVLKAEKTVVATKVDAETTARWLQARKPDFSSFKKIDFNSVHRITHLWDLFLMNADEIAADLERLNKPTSTNNYVSGKAVLENESEIFIDEGAAVDAGAILIAENGPVYIGKNARIEAGAIIEGPAAVCEKAVIKPGAKIHSNTTIGPVCKAGGEISNTVFHSYSNKGHDGYLGDSLIGQWCNMGAGTNISNLKNNYSNIRLTDWDSQEAIETGQQFLGTIMGDHSKTAINTRLNTGTVIGINCNIFSSDFPPKFIPSFSWVGSAEIQTYRLEKAFDTMRAVMSRREVELSESYKNLMRKLHKER